MSTDKRVVGYPLCQLPSSNLHTPQYRMKTVTFGRKPDKYAGAVVKNPNGKEKRCGHVTRG